MDLEKIRGALGRLQQDADSEQAWEGLRSELSQMREGTSPELQRLLAHARRAHAQRGEWDAVAELMPLELLTTEDPAERIALLMELARVRQQELLDEPGAMLVFEQVLELEPEDEMAQAALAESKERAASHQEMAAEYLRESNAATDSAYRAAMLMRSAEAEWRFAGEHLDEKKLLGLLAQAAEADPKNQSVQRMLERIYRRAGDVPALAQVLERAAKNGDEDSYRVAAALRLAHLCKHRLSDDSAAAAAYELALSIAPDHAEAMEALVEHYSRHENWDKLVQLYERELAQLDLNRPERAGEMLQIAMLHWKKRRSFADAALWFERIRALEPTSGAMLEFFREYSAQIGDEALLLKVLQGAQRVLPEGQEKQAVTQEIAKLAEGQEDAQKAIDQYKALLRQNPAHREAREALKSLYRKTQGYNQLVELLRHELEAVPESATEERLRLLREVAGVYREHVPSETSLVSALNQILQVDDKDAAAVRELIGLYEKLGRWRDLLANQQRLAELTDDSAERAQLLRSAGQRWLSQFSNVQNATAAFEALLKVVPDDREARDTLADLYRKRRAWPALYALFESEVESLSGAQRIGLMKEMASLAAERLGQSDAAARLYREILEAEPTNLVVLDALEKHAERSKDFSTLAWALELRAKAEQDATARVAALQKLGNVYAEQLKDPTKSVDAWRRVLEVQPGNARAIRTLREAYLESAKFAELEELYASQNDYEALAEVLSNAADKATDLRQRIDLSYRAARTYEEKLGQKERAFRSYERILAADPMDTKAARALVPLYEHDEKWARLPALYELLVSEANGPAERFEIFSRLYHVTAQRLSDRAAAVGYARRAYEAEPERPDALGLLYRACEDAGQWQQYTEALEQRLKAEAPAEDKEERSGGKQNKRGGNRKRNKSRPDAAAKSQPEQSVSERPLSEQSRRLQLSLAEVYEHKLRQPEQAISTLRRLLQSAPEDQEVAELLERLLRESGQAEGLRWYFLLRAESTSDPAAAIQMLHTWAELEEHTFGEPRRAAKLYGKALELQPGDARSLEKLPKLLISLGDAQAAADVIERHKGFLEPGLAARLEVELAEIYIDRLEQPELALAASLSALTALRELGDHAGVPRAVEVLQRLVEIDSTRRKAAEALAEVYHGAQESRREADALGVLLDIEKQPARRLELLRRAMSVYEQLGSHGKAFELSLRACREFPDHLELWDQGASLSNLSGRPTELAEVYREVLRGDQLPKPIRRQLCERAAQLHEEQLGDPVGATPYLEQVLMDDPSDAEAFARLKQILTSAQRWDELRSLYDQAIQVLVDDESKIEALAEVAMVCEEFMDDSQAAMRYYEEIRKLDPRNELALEALDRLWTAHRRYADLTQLLEQRMEVASGESLREFRLRLASLYLDNLHQPENALRYVEDVLTDEPGNAAGRELAERLLQISALRVPASLALERVYEARDDVRDWVRVLEVRLQAISDPSTPSPLREEHPKDALLRQIAHLYNHRLRDDEGALAALLQLVPLDPESSEARQELLEITARAGASAKVAEALEQAAAAADSLTRKGEILMQAASLYETGLNNRERAEALFQQALNLDPADPDLVLPAAKALERIQRQSESHAALVNTLRVRLRLEQDPEERARLWQQIAELCEDRLRDDAAAINAYKSLLEESPDDAAALVALDRLYERTEDWKALVDVLEARTRGSVSQSDRHELMRRTALIFVEKLRNAPDAIAVYRNMLDEFGPNKVTAAALAELYASLGQWDDLAEIYDRLIELSEDSRERLDLLAKIGDLRRQHLANPGGALDAYRQITQERPDHPEARAALEGMLEGADALNRRDAAEILLPLYSGENNHRKLLFALTTLADVQDDPVSRLDVLQRAAKVASHDLGDHETALTFTTRALREGVGHADLKPWLDELERLAGLTSQRRLQAKVLAEIAPGMFDAEAQYGALMRVATLGRDELDDRELALSYFNKALEVQPESDEALLALEKLYAAGNDTTELLSVLERRADIARDDASRKTLLLWKAQLLDEKLQRPDDAMSTYESILDIDLDERATDALVQLYTREKRWTRLIDLYQRKLEQKPANRAQLHVATARILVEQLNDAPRAFDELEAALEASPQSPEAIAELERLMSEGDDLERHARAASLLEPIYLARADFDRVMRTLEARLPGADPVDRRELLQRLAQLHEEQKEDYRAALETVAKLLHEDPSDWGTVSELERLAKVSDSRSRLVEIYAAELAAITRDDEASANLSRRAAELYRELGDSENALSFFRRALAFEPDNVQLFEAVDAILAGLERHAERVELYRTALLHRFDPEDRLRLLHTVGSLQNEQLGNPDQAIAAYVEALEIHPDDPIALDTLSRLYFSTQRFEELYELVLKRAEAARDGKQATPFRLALAKLCRHELADPSRAVDQLEEIVRIEPTNAEAIAELESMRKESLERQRVVELLTPLYERLDDWRHLIKLNEDRFELAEHVIDKVNVLRQTAVLWEQRGRDANRALQALVAAVQLDPDDESLRAEFERLVEQTGSWNKLAEVYANVLARQSDLTSARALWLKLAQVHDGPRNDPRAALAAYRHVHELDASEIEPIERMEALATLLSDWETLDTVLVAKVELLLDDEARASTWRRIGEGRRDMLAQPRGAIAAYEHALEIEPDSAFTLDCLIELYEEQGNPERLVELYRRRVEITGPQDAELSFALLVQASRLYETHFADRAQAIEMLNWALERKPRDRDTLLALHRLYVSLEQWPELIENLRAQADAAESSAARVAARREMADVLVAKLESFEEALDAYALVLDEAPNDEAARVKVQRLGEQHEELRARVAEILLPALIASGAHQQHVEVLELRLSVESDPVSRAQTLRAAAEVLQQRLNDNAGALKASLRAMAEVPEDPSAHQAIERLCQTKSDWGAYADALSERAQNTFDAELARDLYARLGEIVEARLSDPGRAIDAYRRAVDQVGDQPELLLALDRLYDQAKNWTELVDVLERRIPLAGDDSERAELYFRLARVQLDEFGELGQGLDSLRVGLELSPAHEGAILKLESLTENPDMFMEAADVLEGVYRARGTLDKLSALFAKRVSFAQNPAERIELQRRLAELMERELNDPGGAQKIIEAGLVSDPGDPELLSELERLAARCGQWRAAAEALENAVARNKDLPAPVAKDLSVKAAEWYANQVEDLAQAEAAYTRAASFDPNNEDVLIRIEQLQAAQGRELARVATLRARARLQYDEQTKEQLYKEAIAILAQRGEAVEVEAVLREVLSADPHCAWALWSLLKLRTDGGDARETFEVLTRLLGVVHDAQELRQLRHQAAELAANSLGDRHSAIELWQAAFEDDPLDEGAVQGLRKLYAELGKHQQLGALIERSIDTTDDAGARARLRLELAQLMRERFKEPARAIETLRIALEDDPTFSDAVVTLSQLYEEQGRDEELAELLTEQIRAAQQRGDTASELSLEVRLAEVYEGKLADTARATETYARVLERDPQHPGALRARVRLARKNGDAAATRQFLERLWAVVSGPEQLQVGGELVQAQLDADDLEQAAATLERLVELEPSDTSLRVRLRELYQRAQAWSKLAGLLTGEAERHTEAKQRSAAFREAARIYQQQLSDPGRAAELLELASAAEPTDRALLLELCDAYNTSGQADKAITALEKVVESFGGRRSKELADVHRRLAAAYQAQGQADRAAAELDRAFRIEPGNVQVLKALGVLSLELNDLPRAQQMFRALLLQKLEVGSPITKAEVFYYLAVVHQRLNEGPKAIQMLERALQAEPNLVSAQQLMAQLRG